MFEILAVICAVFVWIAYHKIFKIVYFNFSRGCITEIIGSLFGGAIVAFLIMNYWFLAIPLIVFVVYKMIKK